MKQLCHTNAIVLTATTNMVIPNGRFSKKVLYILHLHINILIPKIDKVCCASIIGISESKLDSSMLNTETEIEVYDVIRMDCSRTPRWSFMVH